MLHLQIPELDRSEIYMHTLCTETEEILEALDRMVLRVFDMPSGATDAQSEQSIYWHWGFALDFDRKCPEA